MARYPGLTLPILVYGRAAIGPGKVRLLAMIAATGFIMTMKAAPA